MNQGSMANMNGKIFEEMMIPIFEAHGFLVINESEIPKYSPLPERVVIKNASYITIYNERGRTEFVIFAGERTIRVEAKYQSAPGSVDEKYPYMLLNGIYKYPEDEIIFVVDGGGYKKGAREWLQNQIDNDWLYYKEQGKNIQLMTIAEFMNWFNHTFG